MYEYVSKATVKPYRSFCLDKLNRVKQKLWNDKKIESTFHLVGSGAKNIVTRNGNQRFDLDFTFEILNYGIDGIESEWLKNYIMDFLNKITKNTKFSFKNCEDSRAAITLVTSDELEFNFDIAILVKNKNNDFCRLIHDKKQGEERYFWNKLPNPKDLEEKTKLLKQRGLWNDVRKIYLEKKNMYLAQQNFSQPSFIVFVETVNEVYSTKFGDKK